MPSSSPSRTTASRSRGSLADERVHHLLEWLRSGERLTTALAAAKFHVSRRTISRDLAHLRRTLSLDVAFDSAQNSYVLAPEHSALPFLAFPSLAPVLLNGRRDSTEGHADSPAEIKVRYSARAIHAYLARGGTLPIDALAEGETLDVYYRSHNLDEFLSYVLSRGHSIEVLEPPELRKQVHMEIRRMRSIYEDEGEAGP